jgi:anti-anti-sigma factor
MHDNAVVPSGRLDSVTAPDFLAAVNTAIRDSGSSLLIDFSRVSYISSAGLRVILIAAKAMAAKGGRLALCALGPQVAEVFSLSEFGTLPNLSVHPSREAAHAALATDTRRDR